MTKTSNYQLSQWAASDPVKRTDFNADNQKIDAAIAAVSAGMLKTEVGSYTGNGNRGSSSPNSLTFGFPPKMVVIVANLSSSLRCGTVLIRGQSKSDGIGGNVSGGTLNLNIQWSGNTVTWYSAGQNADYQLNGNGTTYYYFAIG